LRLTRKGSEATFFAAEGLGGAFRELCRHDLGTEDLKIVRLGALSGSPAVAVDLRIVDLQIRTPSPLTGVAVAPSSPSPTTTERGRSGGWLVAGGFVGRVILLPRGVGLAVRPRRPAGSPARAASPPVSVRCPGCGKSLRAKADLAGKKVRCPQCS